MSEAMVSLILLSLGFVVASGQTARTTPPSPVDFINVDAPSPTSQQAGNVVRTLEGSVFGTFNQTKNKKVDFFAYRGIPYAVPPLGELRFKVRPVSPLLMATAVVS
jgi:hypothetical protein